MIVSLPLFPVSLLGSLPRQRWLIQVLRDRDAGNIPDVEWQMLADYAVRDAVQLQEAAGVDIITDGEQRRDSFLTFVAERLFGIRSLTLSERVRMLPEPMALEAHLQALDVPLTALKSPVVSDVLRVLNPHNGIVLEELEGLRKHTAAPVRIALPGPYTLSRSLWSTEHTRRVYASMEELGDAITALLASEVQRLAERQVDVVQIDEPALMALVDDPETRFAGALLSEPANDERETERAVSLINAVVRPARAMRSVLHVSQRAWSRTEPDGPADSRLRLEPLLMQLDVAELSLGSWSDDPAYLSMLGRLGERKRISLGVVSARSDAVESPELLVSRARTALGSIPASHVSLTTDSGFAPNFERNLNTWETAQAKLESLVTSARMLRSQ